MIVIDYRRSLPDSATEHRIGYAASSAAALELINDARAMYDPVIQRMKDMASPAVILSGNKDEGFLFGNVRPHPLPPGRGCFVDGKYGARLTQTAFLPPRRFRKPADETVVKAESAFPARICLFENVICFMVTQADLSEIMFLDQRRRSRPKPLTEDAP
ncbi:hypothetical protein [Streptosporangium roseum]|uniref:hypothetical protein n=1 Tax=Streptosporangium roseum TaxID=2001 RepID=UPI0018CC67B2|nr:hypothetical protein [Streptosporangium roseum]